MAYVVRPAPFPQDSASDRGVVPNVLVETTFSFFSGKAKPSQAKKSKASCKETLRGAVHWFFRNGPAYSYQPQSEAEASGFVGPEAPLPAARMKGEEAFDRREKSKNEEEENDI